MSVLFIWHWLITWPHICVVLAPTVYAAKSWWWDRRMNGIDRRLIAMSDRIEAQNIIISKQQETIDTMTCVMERRGMNIKWPWDKMASA